MARLVWGADGERFFEAGIDRAVLYVPGAVGVAWPGIKSINETPSGGTPQPYYVDGFKYANISSAEEFEATLEAFSSPREFAQCEGRIELAAGLSVSQQPRKSFGLAYRTKIGDDVRGLNQGYRIHLIYNALAAPSGRNNASIGESVEPLDLSWTISTSPASAAFGYKPTAHFVVDTRYAPRGFVAALEDILYGTTNMNASMPTAAELIAMASGPGPNVYRNLVKNPSAEASTGEHEIRRNYAANPDVEGALVWFLLAGTPAAHESSVDTTFSHTGTASLKLEVTGAGQVGIMARTESDTALRLNTNETLSFSLWVYSTKAGGVYPYVEGSRVQDWGFTGGHAGEQVQIPANVWTQVFGRFTPNQDMYVAHAGVYNLPVQAGDVLWFDEFLIEKSPTHNSYFSGLTPAEGDFTYDWVGTPHASASVQRARWVDGWGLAWASNQWRVYRSNDRPRLGSYVMRCLAKEPTAFLMEAVNLGDIQAGQTGTVICYVRPSVTRLFRINWGGSFGSGLASPWVNCPANEWTELRASQVALTDGVLKVYINSEEYSSPGDIYDIDSGLVLVGDTVYSGEYFDGDIEDNLNDRFSWEGTPHASVSRLESWEVY